MANKALPFRRRSISPPRFQALRHLLTRP